MTPLPRQTPRSQGVDAAAIQAFLDGVERAGIELHSLMLLRHGAVIAEASWTPYVPGQLNLLYSLSKSFTSTAAGLAIAEGRFGLDDRVVDLLPDLVPDDLDPRWREVTVRHCLTMSTGHLDDPRVDPNGADWVRQFFAIPPDRAPGSVFTYNQMATHTVGRIVAATTGERMLDYLRPRLLEPLGIAEAAWFTDGRGHDCGFSGMHLSTEAIARFGQLLLRRGEWDGRQLVPQEWVAEATSRQVPNDEAHRKPGEGPGGADWGRGYGFQFWMCRNGFRGDGAYGQFCLVLPEHDAVLATTADTEQMQDLLDQVWTHLLPGFDGSSVEASVDASAVASATGSVYGSVDADEALVIRLDRAHLAGPSDDGTPWETVELERSGGDAAGSVRSVRVTPHGVELRTDDKQWRMPVGRGAWEHGLWADDPGAPFASWGGWSDGRFVAHLRMIQTPHLLVLTADPAAGTASLAWRTYPLHGPEPEWNSLRYG